MASEYDDRPPGIPLWFKVGLVIVAAIAVWLAVGLLVSTLRLALAFAGYVIVAFLCRPIRGDPHVHDDESLEIRYFDRSSLPPMRPDQSLRFHSRRPDAQSGTAPPCL